MAETTLVIPADRIAALERILRRSIAADAAEIRRLTTLATAYFDRPAGRDVDDELEAARQRHRVAEELLRQLLG